MQAVSTLIFNLILTLIEEFTMIRTDWMGFVTAVLVLLANMVQVSAEEPVELLASLRNEDKVVSQIYLESVRVIPREWTEWYPRRERVKFTRRDRLYAVEIEFDEILKAGNQLPGKGKGRGIGGPPSVPLLQYYLFDSEKSASRHVTALEQDDSGVPNKTGPSQVFQHVYSPDDASETMFIFMPKWLLGRGFSEHVTSLKLDRKSEDGILHASGPGFFTPTMTGTWSLVLDPTHAMLAREAEFVQDGANQPMLRVKTSGILKPFAPANSPVEFAAEGHYIQFHGKNESSIDIENIRVSLEMDEPFYTAIHDKFDEQLPDGSMLIDSRGKEDVVRVAKPEKANSDAAKPVQNHWTLKVFYINVGVLGAVLFYWFLRKLRNKPASNGAALQ